MRKAKSKREVAFYRILHTLVDTGLSVGIYGYEERGLSVTFHGQIKAINKHGTVEILASNGETCYLWRNYIEPLEAIRIEIQLT